MISNEAFLREYQDVLTELRRYLEERLGVVNAKTGPAAKTPSLHQLKHEVESCSNCPLHKTRKNVVFGRGSPNALLLFIGEAPGRDEDIQGEPFVGAAGRLLHGMLKQAGISLDDIYIANILKCRPPKNRDPLPEEIQHCLPYLERQIALIQPRLICTLGKFAAQNILSTTQGITALRGRTFSRDHATVLPTFHPAACIYRPGWKQYLLQDLQQARQLIEDSA